MLKQVSMEEQELMFLQLMQIESEMNNGNDEFNQIMMQKQRN